MDEHEARAVARVIAAADGGISAVPPLIRLATALLPEWEWEQLVADVDPAVAGPQTSTDSAATERRYVN